MSSLDERLDAESESWRPEPGEKISGTIVDVTELESQYGAYPLIVIATDDGKEVAIHCFRTVLKNEIAKKKPQIGDRLGVKYTGQVPDKDFHGYRVVLERAAAGTQQGLDWDAIQAAAEGELAETETAAKNDTPAEMPF